MSIPESGRPHMAGLLMTQKIRWQNCYITSKMLYCYMSDDCICNRKYLSMCCSYIIAEWLYNILLTSHEKNSQMNFKIKICRKSKTLFEGVLLKVKYLTVFLPDNLLIFIRDDRFKIPAI